METVLIELGHTSEKTASMLAARFTGSSTEVLS